MNKFFFSLTKSLSIKRLVLLGVYIMTAMVSLFAVVMYYLSTTIKYDQNTMKHILAIEEQNKYLLDDIHGINALDVEILTTKDINTLEIYDDVVVNPNIKHQYIELTVNNPLSQEYNKHVKDTQKIIDQKYKIQAELLEKRITVLEYQDDLNDYLDNFEEYSEIVHFSTNMIYSIASANSNNQIKILAKDFNNSVLKVLNSVNKIVVANDINDVNTIKRKHLNKDLVILEDNLQTFLSYGDSDLYQREVNIIQSNLTMFKDIIASITMIKQLQINLQMEMNQLLEERSINDQRVFSNVYELNDISKTIKYDILQNSDNISQNSAIIIITTGIVFLILVSIAASVLIYRINYPLSTMVDYIHHISLKGDSLSHKLPIYIKDEFGKLSITFNSMTSKLSKSFKKIENLYKEIQDTQKEVIFTMGAIGESRSKETGNHVKRVAEYSKLLAKYYGLSEDEAEMLKQASPMHDIGKVAIPDAILNKPGGFTQEERLVMDTHTQLGFDMLKHSKRSLLQCAAIVAHEHHEKWDGSGYPRGLKAEEIHIYGRITALADVFDALGSDRCYKKAWEDERIFQLFKDQSGKHFDPKLVDIFFEHIDEFLKIRDRLKDSF